MLSRLPLALASLVTAALGAWCSFMTLGHAALPVYDLSPRIVTIVLLTAGVAVLAATALVVLNRPRITFPVLLVGLTVGFTFLVFPTLGLLLLIVLLVVAAARLSGQVRWLTGLASAASAGTLALALTLLLVASNQQPVVRGAVPSARRGHERPQSLQHGEREHGGQEFHQRERHQSRNRLLRYAHLSLRLSRDEAGQLH